MNYPCIEYLNPSKNFIVTKVLTLSELEQFLDFEPDWPFLAISILESYQQFNNLHLRSAKRAESASSSQEQYARFDLSEEGLKRVESVNNNEMLKR